MIHTLETALDELVALSRALRAHNNDSAFIAEKLGRLDELRSIIRYYATTTREPARILPPANYSGVLECSVPGCTNGFPLYNSARLATDPVKWFCLPHFPDDGRAFIVGLGARTK